MSSPRLVRAVAAALLLTAAAAAQTPVVTFTGETMRLRSATVAVGTTANWNLTLQMEDDNQNAALGTSFRRWWHAQVGNLNPAGSTLRVTITNAGYTDIILPVWSLSTDGVTFGAYQRLPTGAVPTLLTSTQHRFTVAVPTGVVAFRLAKYFPYSVTRKDAWLATLAGDPRVRSIVSLGNSQQGRPIHKIQLTDPTRPDAGKRRVWIHAGIHPAETTSYFTVEGLVAWLRSGASEAEALLDGALVDIVPMANPDGVFLGNYRTNANSSNLENEWSAPYTSPQPEIAALRTAIEACMGTVASPGGNPIRVLLNLHSSHGVAYPFHFQHVANPSWNPTSSNTGVLPVVNQLEGQWISAFAARSPFVDLGATQSSALLSRPFVESMCHDRWTGQPGWLTAPGLQSPVMAITFEGTYGRGPDTVTWNTEADYRLCGEQLGQALFDHLGLQLGASVLPYGPSCLATTLQATLTALAGGAHDVAVQVGNGAPNGLGVLAIGGAPAAQPLAAPFPPCLLLNTAEGLVPFGLDAAGGMGFSFTLPASPGLGGWLQVFTYDAALGPYDSLDASNGLQIRNDY